MLITTVPHFTDKEWRLTDGKLYAKEEVTELKFNPRLRNLHFRGGPSGIAVKFTRSASAARQTGVRRFGSQARTDAQLVKPCCGSVPYKVEEDGHGC